MWCHGVRPRNRIKDVIRRRGENISAFEVERALQSHPDVAAAAAVIPVPSELGEDEVMACVTLREGASLSPADFVAFCAERLAFAVPRYVEFLGELPLTPSGRSKSSSCASAESRPQRGTGRGQTPRRICHERRTNDKRAAVMQPFGNSSVRTRRAFVHGI
jgi:acyl-CoA synthetase (AMP-forming)/AMP-acid ligase II